jgi:hypothetical protein
VPHDEPPRPVLRPGRVGALLWRHAAEPVPHRGRAGV